MRGSRSLSYAALVVLVALPPGAAGQTHPFSVHDMLAMDRIGDPQVSHDGELVVFEFRPDGRVARVKVGSNYIFPEGCVPIERLWCTWSEAVRQRTPDPAGVPG
mgnify:CR=1 FL=1